MMKWGLIFKVLGIVAVLLIMKLIVAFFEIDVISASTLTTAFVGGVIFIIGFILVGILSDFKEAEKIPGELASSIKTLYYDTRIACAHNSNGKKMVGDMQCHVKELLHAVTSNFRQNDWKQREVNQAAEKIDSDILVLAENGVAPQFIVKLRSELANVDKISNRIETIKETSFIPAAYSIAQLSIGMAIGTLLFTKLDPFFEELTVFGAISTILISLILLIKDMDDPFEVGKKSYADVDLKLLYKLEDHLNNR